MDWQRYDTLIHEAKHDATGDPRVQILEVRASIGANCFGDNWVFGQDELLKLLMAKFELP